MRKHALKKWLSLGFLLLFCLGCAHSAENMSGPQRNVAQASETAASHWAQRVQDVANVDFAEYCNTSDPENPNSAKNICLKNMEHDCAICAQQQTQCPACEKDHVSFCELKADNQCATARWLEHSYSQYSWCDSFFIKPPLPQAQLSQRAEDAAAKHEDMPKAKAGHFGPLSQVIFRQIAMDIQTKGESSPFMGQYQDIQLACPGFQKMNALERVGFYTYLMEILSYNETSCNPRMINDQPDVPNLPAVGLYQLENKISLRKARPLSCQSAPAARNIRHGRLTGEIQAGSIMDPVINAKCATDILGHLLKKNQALFGAPGKGSYWQSLDPAHTTKKMNGRVVKLTDDEIHNQSASRLRRDLCWYPLCHVDGEGRVDENAARIACQGL